MMPEARDERERILANPLRLLRCALDLGRMARRFDDDVLEYNEINYPPITHVEAPVATEAELG